MSAVFADTFYWLGLNHPGDSVHAKCLQFAHEYRGNLVTTTAVLLEYANSASKPPYRIRAAAFIAAAEADPQLKIVPLTPELFDRGRGFYAQHSDKDWSLTDCISFLVMRDEGIAEAATGDRDFEQAGFTALLK